MVGVDLNGRMERCTKVILRMTKEMERGRIVILKVRQVNFYGRRGR